MSSYIHYEMLLFLQSVITGAALLLCYDILRAVRKVIPHSGALIALEDLIFWPGCGLAVFMGIYRSNQGILRFFLFLGAGLGVLLCSLTVSSLFVKMCTRILEIPAVLSKKVIKWLIFPVRRCKIFCINLRKKKGWQIGKNKEKKQKKENNRI